MSEHAYQHVKNDSLGQAFPPDGRHVNVRRVEYDRPHAMTGQSVEYVVEVSELGNQIGAYGFSEESDAWRFVTGGPNTYYENAGHAGTGTRDGLAIPDAYITGRGNDVSNDERLSAALRNTETQANQIAELRAQNEELSRQVTDLGTLIAGATDPEPEETKDHKSK